MIKITMKIINGKLEVGISFYLIKLKGGIEDEKNTTISDSRGWRI